MEKHSAGRSNKPLLPGRSSPKFQVVTPVQETLGQNMSNAGNDKTPLSPVSDQGQKARDFYRKSGSGNASGGNNDKDGFDDTTDMKEDAEDHADVTEEVRNFSVKNEPLDQQNPTVSSNGYQTLGIDSNDKSSSFMISSSELPYSEFQSNLFKRLSYNSWSERPLQTIYSMEQLYRIVHHNVQDRHLNSMSDSESGRALLKSFEKKVFNWAFSSDNLNIPSLSAYCLFPNQNTSIVDPMTSVLFSTLRFSKGSDPELKIVFEALCSDSDCSKPLCLQFQESLKKLQDFEIGVRDLSDEEKLLLWHMYQHCCSCKHLYCPFYWCQKTAVNWSCEVSSRLLLPKHANKILLNMKQLVEHYYHGNFMEEMKSGSFSKDFPDGDLPVEGKYWSGLCHLKYAKNSIFALSNLDHREYWILKKNLMFKSRSQIKLYEELGQISHKGITQHLWTAFCPDTLYMVVCTPYITFSLDECLQHSPIKDIHCVVRLMLQVIPTTHYLHDHGILYLNWSSKNILYDTPEQFRLSNFTHSALKSRLDVDIGDIIASLPRHLFTPEMLGKTPVIDERTDIWGLGCLLKEVFTGQHVWYEDRHEPDNVLNKKIKERTPTKPDGCLALFHIFRACWEKEPGARPDCEELQNMLVEAERYCR